MLKRLAIVALAFLLGIGATAQVGLLASTMPMDSGSGAPCEMATDAGAPDQGLPKMPCNGKIPGCIGSIGCVAFGDFPGPIAATSPVDWIVIAWSAGGPDLTGLSVEPELSPPIRNV
jgi:hypothetical protein